MDIEEVGSLEVVRSELFKTVNKFLSVRDDMYLSEVYFIKHNLIRM
jgi:hypothetical protein